MNDILKNIYLGKLSVDQLDIDNPEYAALLAEEEKLYTALAETVGFACADRYTSALNAVCSCLCEYYFERGVQMGGQLVLAILKNGATPA